MRTTNEKTPYTHIANRFSASGDLYFLGRKFHSLNSDRRRFVAELMRAGYEPETAIAKARSRCIESLLPFMAAKV